MTPSYPGSFAAIGAWAEMAGMAVAEARLRFAQYAVLRGIASVPLLQRGLVLKGGNALDFFWQPNRSTVDLDFSVDPTSDLSPLDGAKIRALLDRGLPIATSRLGVVLAVHRVRQNPRGTDKDFVTYETRIGYALQDEVRLRQRMSQGEFSPNVVDIDISLNDPICDSQLFQVDPSLQLRIATMEDIVAEKLRALLQQPIRNRQRRQDLLDIAVILREHPGLDRPSVAKFLQEKAAARAVPVTRAAFHNPEVARRARVDYDELAVTTRVAFVPFDDALALLHALVADLAIED